MAWVARLSPPPSREAARHQWEASKLTFRKDIAAARWDRPPALRQPLSPRTQLCLSVADFRTNLRSAGGTGFQPLMGTADPRAAMGVPTQGVKSRIIYQRTPLLARLSRLAHQFQVRAPLCGQFARAPMVTLASPPGPYRTPAQQKQQPTAKSAFLTTSTSPRFDLSTRSWPPRLPSPRSPPSTSPRTSPRKVSHAANAWAQRRTEMLSEAKKLRKHHWEELKE